MRTEPSFPDPSIRPRRGGGAGFTLIELLAVVAIITIVASALTVVLGNMASNARVAATKTLIEKIHTELDKRIHAFEQLDLRRQIQAEENLLSALGLSPTDAKRLAPVIVKKELFRQYFPQRFSETAGAMTAGASHVAKTESAEVLYRLLTQGDVLGVPPVGDGFFTASEVRDTDSDGYDEFVDSWGEPLRFYRWPTRLVRPGGFGTPVNKPVVETLMPAIPPDMLDQDPGDPLDLMGTVGPIQRGYSRPLYEQQYHTPLTYSLPLIVSAGSDRILGLYEPSDVANFGYLAQPDQTQQDAQDSSIVILTDPGKSVLNDNHSNHQARGGR